MPAPTLGSKTVTPAKPGAAKAPAVIIPFTRAARKKSKIFLSETVTLSGAVQQLAPILIPAGGYLRRIEMEVVAVAAGNTAAVAFNNDGPFAMFNAIGVQSASGDTIHPNMSGFTWSRLQKYGAFSSNGANAPESDPTYSVITGAVAAGGSFTFSQDVPFEFDERDGSGSLPNMASNQQFQLNVAIGSLTQIYSVAPTAAPTVTITFTMHYWAMPAAVNAAGIAQQTAPPTNNLLMITQSSQPAITPSSDQVIQSVNVGNAIRFIYFELRTAAGVRTDADWPNAFNLLVNNDIWMAKRKIGWKRQLGKDYALTGASNAVPTAGALDNGVFVLDDFINSGSQGNIASGSSNRDLPLVTNSATALDFEFNQFGAAASQLIIVTCSLRIPDPAAFYAPKGV